MDKYALAAWSARVLIRALERPRTIEYEPGLVDLDFMREVARLSLLDRGPVLAQEFLWKHGIQLIIEPHLPRTLLDGAAIMAEPGKPVIGLTLRYDRLDNFWYVLMHELVHVAKHLLGEPESFFDDLDTPSGEDRQEQEADELADKALIPETEWRTSPAKVLRSPEAAKYLADRLGIHPAIVAGRMRYEARNFRILNQLVGLGQVRPLFPDAKRSNRKRR
jgi:HTH-type transcriptional regulator/antitoxin HigA